MRPLRIPLFDRRLRVYAPIVCNAQGILKPGAELGVLREFVERHPGSERVGQDSTAGEQAVERRLDGQLIPMDPPSSNALGAVHSAFVLQEKPQNFTRNRISLKHSGEGSPLGCCGRRKCRIRGSEHFALELCE